jgi:hypothetical protein
MNTLGRAHYYLELSSWLKIPLAADPIRSRYFEILFKRLNTKSEQGVPEKVISYFDQAILGKDGSEIGNRFSVDLSLPPVAEYVANYAQLKRCTLYDAVMEVRNSKHVTQAICGRLAGDAVTEVIARKLLVSHLLQGIVAFLLLRGRPGLFLSWSR